MTEQTTPDDEVKDDRDDREGDPTPVVAGRFAITDLQHWIDLCA